MPYISETGVKKPPRLKLNVDFGGGGRGGGCKRSFKPLFTGRTSEPWLKGRRRASKTLPLVVLTLRCSDWNRQRHHDVTMATSHTWHAFCLLKLYLGTNVLIPECFCSGNYLGHFRVQAAFQTDTLVGGWVFLEKWAINDGVSFFFRRKQSQQNWSNKAGAIALEREGTAWSTRHCPIL